MTNVIETILAVIILFPFIITMAIVTGMRKKGKSLSTVMGYAADWTTPFLFVSVYIIMQSIVGESITLYIVAIAVIIALLYAIFERVRVKEFIITRLLRKVWRLFFLLLTAVYVLALLIGLVFKVIEYTV